MKRFIEINFSQDTEVQRELIPVSSVIDAYVELPYKKSIRISYKVGKRIHKVSEYYRTELECAKRFVYLRKQLGVEENYFDLCPICEPKESDVNE